MYDSLFFVIIAMLFMSINMCLFVKWQNEADRRIVVLSHALALMNTNLNKLTQRVILQSPPILTEVVAGGNFPAPEGVENDPYK